jgi:hypothetical protein
MKSILIGLSLILVFINKIQSLKEDENNVGKFSNK